MKFATKLRLAMSAESCGALALSKNVSYKISAKRISELADAHDEPTPVEISLLSATLKVPLDWFANKSNTPPRKIINSCIERDLLPASFKGELTDDVLSHMMELLQHKEKQ